MYRYVVSRGMAYLAIAFSVLMVLVFWNGDNFASPYTEIMITGLAIGSYYFRLVSKRKNPSDWLLVGGAFAGAIIIWTMHYFLV